MEQQDDGLTAQNRKHIPNRLPSIYRHALIADRVCVLALPVIDVAAIDEVDRIDKELSTPHRFDEVARLTHLGHILDE